MDQSSEVLDVLRTAAKAVQDYYADEAHKYGLEPSQLNIMLCLWQKDGMTPLSLAEELHVTPATITSILIRLEKKGLCHRYQPTKKRSVTVWLTPVGKDMEFELIQRLGVLNTKLIEDIPENELQTCISLLQRLEQTAKLYNSS